MSIKNFLKELLKSTINGIFIGIVVFILIKTFGV